LLPLYKGSILRGGFGRTFKSVVCTVKDKNCDDCILKPGCLYSYIFDTFPPDSTEIMRKYKSIPRPFIIEPPLDGKKNYEPGEEIEFKLILIGRAIDYLPYFIYTFEEFGKKGIGKAKGKFELFKVRNIRLLNGNSKNSLIYNGSSKIINSFEPEEIAIPYKINSSPSSFQEDTLSLSFLTPTRIYYNEHLTLNLEFHILIRNLLRRISLLYYFHCKNTPLEINFRKAIKDATDVKVRDRRLEWYEWKRYSSTQKTKLKMGGFVGNIAFRGNIKPFMLLIKAGEILHIGKGTTFGLGKYEIK
jgi:hypothetical protein